jgi:superfamily II DNA or RNA helicase
MHHMDADPIHLKFDGGTLVVTGANGELLSSLPGCRFDPRSGTHRAEARCYRDIVEHLVRLRLPYKDEVRTWQQKTPWPLRSTREPFPHQKEALEAWWQNGGRGVVVLPTGTGKTHVALMAIERAARPTLVITPTIDLLNQWYGELLDAFGEPVGLLGGGDYDLQPLTVSTYDSSYIHYQRFGNRFGLLIFDECHHLPGQSYMEAAIGSIAPYRLGLTATPERSDARDALLPDLIGPIIYRREIPQLAGVFLAEYRVERLFVDLSPEEQEQYRQARDQYRGFVMAHGISMSSQGAWQRFIMETTRSPEGRAAFLAYRAQKQLAQAAPAKIHLLGRLLDRHHQDRILIFTADNATVYQIASRFLVPAITYQTKAKERRKILQRFHAGEYPILVTGQVLDEGVDIPAANVGVILGGSGSTRQHVQRLGRLLRRHGEKQALLYEVVTRGTAEEFTSERRRQHHAYQSE